MLGGKSLQIEERIEGREGGEYVKTSQDGKGALSQPLPHSVCTVNMEINKSYMLLTFLISITKKTILMH